MKVKLVRDDSAAMPAPEFETIEEAIGEAMRQLDGEGVIAVHDAECAHDGKSDASCTCTPLELKLGAES